MTKLDPYRTRILPFDDSAIHEAAQLIASGEPVAIATETVYGLAADAGNAAAVTRIYEAKGRPAFNPLIVHVPDLAAARMLGHFDDAALSLAEDHWPGPLTLVVQVREGAPLASLVTAGLRTIGIRVPTHPAMRALLAATRVPLAAPSANASGSISPTRAEHVHKSLRGKIALIVDAGACEEGIESTIVAAYGEELRVLRPGPITLDLPAVQGAAPIAAPGMLASHYAPTKPLRLEALKAREGEYLIGFGSVTGERSLSESGDLAEAAQRLFDLLHHADSSAFQAIAVAPIPGHGLGAAINDRLVRAATPRDQ